MACKSRECVNEWFTHTHMNVLHLQTYIVLYKCFGVCTCMYCIPIMIVPSYKSILISCGCFQSSFFFFLQWATLISPFKKQIMIFWYSPNISIFYQYRTMVVLFKEISWNAHFVPPHCLSTTFVTTIIFVSNIW